MSTTVKLNGNPEHGGIAFVILIAMIVAVIGFYIGLIRLLPAIIGGTIGDYVVITAVVSLFLGVGAAALLDPLIKKVWPSGYALTFEGPVVRLKRPHGENQIIHLDQDHRVTCWYYKMAGYPRFGRERQIRKGNFLVGCQIQQDEQRIVFHTFASPIKINGIVSSGEFGEINMDEIYDTSIGGRIRGMRPLRTPGSRPEIPATLIVSDQGKFWLAERHRWAEGVELTNGDFVKAIEQLGMREMSDE